MQFYKFIKILGEAINMFLFQKRFSYLQFSSFGFIFLILPVATSVHVSVVSVVTVRKHPVIHITESVPLVIRPDICYYLAKLKAPLVYAMGILNLLAGFSVDVPTLVAYFLVSVSSSFSTMFAFSFC